MRKWIIFVAENSMLFLLLVCAFFVLSLFFVKDLNIEAFPDPAPPIVEIISIYEGRSAEEVERMITVALEVGLAGMRGLEQVNSISLYGLSDIKCKFSYGVDYRQSKQEVINRLADTILPDGVQPNIIANPFGEVMRYNLVGSDNLMELRGIQDWTAARHLRTADGVEDVVTEGGYIKTYNVKVLPDNLIKYGIPLSQVIESLSKANLNVGGRVLEMGDQYYMVRGLGLIKSLSDIEHALVAYKNGKPVLVKNVATVSISNIPRTGITAMNDKDDVVMGTVVLRKDAQSIPSIRSVHQKIQELNERILPKGIKVVPYYERWDLITTVVKKVLETALSGVALVAIALFLFLGNYQAAIITALVIPISLLITLALMALRGESANLLSIGAIDFGIIADIPLILIENYFRVSNKHGHGMQAIIRAADEVEKPMFFSVGIILLAFIPIFMMKGAEAQIFSPMAKTYLYAILFTVILTFSYLVAAKRLFLNEAEDREFGFIKSLRERYVKCVTQLLGHAKSIIILTLMIVVIGLVVGFKMISSQFLPKMDEGNMYIRIIFPYSISLNKTYEYAVRAKNLLRSFPEVKAVDFKIGRPEDGTDPNGPFNSEYTVIVKSYDQWKKGMTKEKLEGDARSALQKNFPNADISVSQYIQDNLEEVMSGVKGQNSVKVFGDDLNILDKTARQVETILDKTKGIADVAVLKELGQPNLLIDVNRETAAALGLTVKDVLDTVAAALGGKEISQVIEGSRRFALLVSFPEEYRKNSQKIESIPIVLPNGGFVSLDRIADIHYDTGASFIYRENFRRYIPIKFAVISDDLGGTVAQAQGQASKLKLSSGYYMEWSGMFNEMKKSFQRFYFSIPISLFLIVTALYILYRSVRNVLITMAAPLFTIFFGLVSLLITGESLSVSSMVGFISITGVSVLNSSILISHYLRLTQEGVNGDIAIVNTIEDKFRPILMGGFVAALGLLPASLARGIGSQVQKPLAIVVVGGMLAGTVMILLFMPLLLKYVQSEE